jgi:hypothetical protein
MSYLKAKVWLTGLDICVVKYGYGGWKPELHIGQSILQRLAA